MRHITRPAVPLLQLGRHGQRSPAVAFSDPACPRINRLWSLLRAQGPASAQLEAFSVALETIGCRVLTHVHLDTHGLPAGPGPSRAF